MARLAPPSCEHYLPPLHAAGAAHEGEPVRFVNEGYQGGSIAMRSRSSGAERPAGYRTLAIDWQT